MDFMVAIGSWILYHYVCFVNFPFCYWILFFSKKDPSMKLLLLGYNINFLRDLSADQTNLEFQIPSLE